MTVKILRDIIEQQVTIPTLPDIITQLNELLSQPSVGPKDIGSALACDPALSAKVLRVANSSYYGLRQSVSSVEQAAAVLGLEALRTLVLQATILGLYEDLGDMDTTIVSELWCHSLLTAQISALLARSTKQPGASVDQDALYTCGLLHDIGKMTLLDCLSERYLAILQEASKTESPLFRMEEQELGFDHCDVGALLAIRWRLPDGVATAIQGHHGRGIEAGMRLEAAIVYVADRVAHCIRENTPENLRYLMPKVRHSLHISSASFRQILAESISISRDIEASVRTSFL